MRVTVIGCSGSIPGPTSASSCYLVEADGFALVLDLGSGSLGPLQRFTDLTSIGSVLLSHVHADHCADVTSLTVALQYGPAATRAAIPVLGPPGMVQRVEQLHGVRGEADRVSLARWLALRDVEASTWSVGPFQVTARAVDHPVPTYAYRVEHGGRVFAYSGDCAPSPGLDEVAAGADLALIEAAFVEDPANDRGVHHTGREAGELATRTGIGRLVVTHIPPWHDPEAAAAAARAAFAGPVDLAQPGASYDV